MVHDFWHKLLPYDCSFGARLVCSRYRRQGQSRAMRVMHRAGVGGCVTVACHVRQQRGLVGENAPGNPAMTFGHDRSAMSNPDGGERGGAGGYRPGIVESEGVHMAWCSRPTVPEADRDGRAGAALPLPCLPPGLHRSPGYAIYRTPLAADHRRLTGSRQRRGPVWTARPRASMGKGHPRRP